MASIEFIQKRIEGKKKEIEKLQKKLERIHKAEASGWKNNPYYYNEHDLKWALRDLEVAQQGLEKYESDLRVEEEKAGSRNVKAILDFLEGWKQRCYEHYEKDIKAAFAELNKLRKLASESYELAYGSPEHEAKIKELEERRKAHREKLYGYYRKLSEEERKDSRYRYRSEVKVRDGEWEYIGEYLAQGSYKQAIERLNKDLKREAERKYDYIIERVNAKVGKIVDAGGLRVGGNGEINGRIIGERGNARVESIGAGGYNIQCFHYRVLVHKEK